MEIYNHPSSRKAVWVKLKYALTVALLHLLIGSAVGQSTLQTADSLYQLGLLESALKALDGAQSFDEKMLTSKCFTELGEYEKAGLALPKEAGLSKKQQVMLGNQQGVLLLYQGDPDAAEERMKKSVAEAEGTDDKALQAETYSQLGVLYWSTGAYQNALDYHYMALGLFQDAYSEKDINVAGAYNNLGLTYQGSGQLSKALRYFKKALKMTQEAIGEFHPRASYINNNIAFVQIQKGKFNEAVYSFKASLEILQRSGSSRKVQEAFVKASMGVAYRSMGEFDLAQEHFEAALEGYKSKFGDIHPEIAGVYNAMSDNYLQQNDYDAAFATNEKAFVANTNGYASEGRWSFPKSEGAINKDMLLSSLMIKAKVLEQRYHAKSLRLKELTVALQCLEEADSIISLLRDVRENPKDKIALGNVASDVYEQAIRICMQLAEVTPKSRFYREKAFGFAERSKATVLLTSIAESRAKHYADLPDKVLAEERKIKSELNRLEQELAKSAGSKSETEARSALLNQKRVYASFKERLQKEYPSYFSLKYHVDLPTSQDIGQWLEEGEALVHYFIGYNTMKLYVFVVRRNGLKIHEVPFREDFDKRVKAYRMSIRHDIQSVYEELAVELFDVLVPFSTANLNHVYIVPDGNIGAIPFEALLTSKVEGELPFSKLPFLLHKFDVSYLFSSDFLRNRKAEEQGKVAKKALLCALVKFKSGSKQGTERYGLQDLPGTKKEVDSLDAFLETNGFSVTKLSEGKAGEKAVKGLSLDDYAVVHFATHGKVDVRHPELSKIYLSESSGEDGMLYTGEIYGLSMDAKLVALSACETGLGKLSRGEGIIGLSRALVYAGADKLLVSLWKVSDASTAQLMMSFYHHHIGENKNAESALREAKQALASSEEFAAPYYWAPFILIDGH